MFPMQTDFAIQIAFAALVAHLTQKVKTVEAISWFNQHTDGLNKIFVAISSFLMSIGITMTFQATPEQGGVFTISGIPTTPEEVLNVLVQTFKQYMLAKGYYLAAIKPNFVPYARGTGGSHGG